MNRLTYATHTLFLSLTIIGTIPSYGQTDAAAKSLLNKVSKTYEGYKTLQADFTLAVQQPQQTNSYTESGTIYMEASTGKYHITTTSQDVISDGKNQWMVLKEAQEVQVTEVDHTSASISPINIFSFYNEGYKYVSAPDERLGNTQLEVVELSPEDASTPYFKIKLRINKASSLIHDATIFDKGGVKYSYTIKNTKANIPIVSEKFTFKQGDYPGMEIVDLR
ncbi:LolA family protein [Parapedobacter koreensis]|uniref:Outer membrane lipoprotein-sorting protein n=1 Tax=Parapedobacter koreensis TaxID=332977 RepID=A0A1H7G4U1_9SPHI|nr:outer membrane lipoprotein carrier protein LolA [Parapedobacter koreensis]SEK33159.1 Outer membrane lipoprotein-sorting protein [Parapedobacter koreensis]